MLPVPYKMENMAQGSFVCAVRAARGADSEVKLLLKVALEHKTSKAHGNIDCESCKSKYVNMLTLFLDKYQSGTNEEFPHAKGDITQGNVAAKMRAI